MQTGRTSSFLAIGLLLSSPCAWAQDATKAPPGTPGQLVPVTIGGQTMNVSQHDAASIKVWQSQLAKLAQLRGAPGSFRTVEMQSSSAQRKQYIVPAVNGHAPAVLNVPSNVQIGAWFSGVGTTVSQPSPLSQLTGGATHLPNSTPQLQPMAMTPQAMAEAIKKYPASEGWNQISLPNQGWVFAKGNPCETMMFAAAMREIENPSFADPCRPRTVDQLGKRMVADRQTERDRRNLVIGTDPLRDQAVEPEVTRFTVSAAAVESQAAEIQAVIGTIEDDGRLLRALAVSELVQSGRWQQGVRRLAKAYLDNPKLVNAPLADDFADATGDTIRSLVTKGVTEAHRTKDAMTWTGVAALMSIEERYAQAEVMLGRARAVAADDQTLQQIDELSKVINAAQRPRALHATP